MSATYYIKDASGTLLSTDRKTAFTALQGKAAYAYLNSEEGQGKHFFIFKDDHGDTVAIEADEEICAEWNREQKASAYHEQRNQQSGKTTVSIDFEQDGLTLAECVGDETINLEEAYETKERVEAVRKAVPRLPTEEQDMLAQLYLNDEPISEREYARQQGLSQTTVNYRKRRVLDKLHGMIA